MKVMVIAAHPDDEVLGCGGTIARLSDEGHDVRVLILGEGITSRSSHREDADRSEVQKLRRQSKRVAKALGVKEIRFFDLPDNRFDTLPLLDIIKILEKYIEDFRPACVYTHNPADLNQDHVMTYRATLIASRPLENSPIKTVACYEVPSSTEWTFWSSGAVFRPNVFVDITQTLDKKIGAMKIYEGESREYPHPRSPEALRAIASRWGSVSGLRAAEAFELVRSSGLWIRD